MASTHFTTHLIYRIVCFQSMACYIGQTSNFKNRIYEHFRQLKLNQHYNIHLQRAFNKYGQDGFYSEVIEKDISSDDIDNREKFWIAHFDSFNNGFNQSPGGDLSYRGKPCTWNGGQYTSITAAASELGIDSASLHERLLNGYTCDSDMYLPGEQCLKPCTWNRIDYPSQNAAAQALGISAGAMKSRIKKGYLCDEDMPQRRACVWNGIHYRSIEQCSKVTGIPRVTLLRWLNRGIVCDEDRPIYRRIK